MKITQIEISTSGISDRQAQVGAMYLCLNGRGANIKDMMACRKAKEPEDIIDLFNAGAYLTKNAEQYHNYLNDIKRGMKSRINMFANLEWFKKI